MVSKFLLVFTLLLGDAFGHGGVFNYTIDGVDYPGHYPWLPEEGQESIQRRWWPDPLADVYHPYSSCNRGNPLAKSLPKLHAPVRAGGLVSTWWHGPPCPPGATNPYIPSVPGDYDRPMTCYPIGWSHGNGPILVYMANCNGPCDKFDGLGKVWFKIYETGLAPGYTVNSEAGWEQYYWTNEGNNVTIPRNLKPGNYLIRHEILMLSGPLQIFPYCAQLTVSGDGNKAPSQEYYASFPGTYDDTDPGFAVAYIPWGERMMTNYTIPGPKVWTGEE